MSSRPDSREGKPNNEVDESVPRSAVSSPAPQRSDGGIIVALPIDSGGTDTPRALGDRLLDKQVQAAIGSQLRLIYNDIANAPVPDRFLKLLDELAAKADKS